MKPRAILLKLLIDALGVFVWWLGWPTLRTLQTALMIVTSLVVLTFCGFGVAFLILIIRSQLEPPYEKI